MNTTKVLGIIAIIGAAGYALYEFVFKKKPPSGACTPGKTKCSGYDLYTCGVDEKWHLTTANSTACGYVPPNGGDEFTCDICGALFPTLALLQAHVTTAHGGFTLTLSVRPNQYAGYITVTPQKSKYALNEIVELRAWTSDPYYYIFSYWEIDGEQIVTGDPAGDNPLYLQVACNHDIVAVFATEPW